jgi:alpha-ketoglutarate-dependent taurine dioxygenase
VAEYRRRPCSITELGLTTACRAECAGDLEPVLAALERGRGFVIIDGLSLSRYSPQEVQVLYWIIGPMLGQPYEQNVQGTLLYDVRDTGQTLAQGARFSVTKYESSFHTDNPFGSEILDYVGLLCLHTAKTGGLSQVVNGYAVYNELLTQHGELLEILLRPFHFERRAGVRRGETPTALVPIIERRGEDLLFRYLRYWIQSGHEKVGKPLSADQVRALDVLDSVLSRRDLSVEFNLRPGQMYFINNRWILHNRTAFEDYPEPDRRRHLVRLWLQKAGGSPP